MTTTELVRYAASEGIGTLTLDSPTDRNALSRRLVADLVRYLERAAQDDTAARPTGDDLPGAADGHVIAVGVQQRTWLLRCGLPSEPSAGESGSWSHFRSAAAAPTESEIRRTLRTRVGVGRRSGNAVWFSPASKTWAVSRRRPEGSSTPSWLRVHHPLRCLAGTFTQ
jgi:hypothetical protein